MIRTIRRSILLFSLVYLLLLTAAGCDQTPSQTSCAHSPGQLHSAVPAGFFEGGSIAYYQCSDCGQLLDEQKCEVDTVATPKRSSALCVCVNGTPTSLRLDSQEAEQISWSLDGLCVAQGDILTVCDESQLILSDACTYLGIVDEKGFVLSNSQNAVVSLVATPAGLTLTVEDYDLVVEINGTPYPMRPQANAYIYGYAQLQKGDQLLIRDHVQNSVHGYDALDAAWSTFDLHRGENGELVIDREGRYMLAFGADGTEQLRISRVFAPAETDRCTVVFPDGQQKNMPMTALQHTRDSLLLEELLLFAADENTQNGTDIAEFLQLNDLYSYSSLLHLEAGTKLYIEDASRKIPCDRLTAVSGAPGCVIPGEDHISVTQAGTYLIRYLPACGSIRVEQLSDQGLWDTAKLFDKCIAAIPSYAEQYYARQIKALYEEYLCFPDSMKSYLSAAAKLETLYRRLTELETTASVIYYLNTESTNNVYRSKEELFTAFYTDFYYYIAVYHGTDHLKNYKIRNVQDFVNLAKDFDGAGLTDLYGIGAAAGTYLLESRRNGILENQTDGAFFGFCYRNGLYRDILPFFTNFFAFWRIDEHYANLSNPGADIFAESWAPTVDIAKFFYYDEFTSYVQTPRVLDCFANIAGVAYGFESGDPLPQLRLRGYSFEGWYDNPQFRGEPLAQLPDTGEPIKLYAKWTVDQAQQDRDAANLVDVYIYNLTTQSAVKTRATVEQVKQMYDALSANAKQLVKEYATLQGLLSQYA